MSLNWYNSGGQSADTIFNLCSGNYYVEVTDINGCSDTDLVSITQPESLNVTIDQATELSCYGDCDGVMSVIPEGGTSPYEYSWYDVDGKPSTQLVSEQCAGEYHVKVNDSLSVFSTRIQGILDEMEKVVVSGETKSAGRN